MITKGRIFILMLFLSLVFAISVNAITATILTGMIMVKVDETPIVIEKSVGVKNTNNVTVNVAFEPSEDIQDIITLEENNITLEPDEERFVKFNITLDKPNAYDSAINAIFSKTNLKPEDTDDKVGMSMRLLIVPDASLETEPEDNKPGEGGFGNIFLFAGIGLAAIITVILIILKLTRWNK